MRHRSWVMGVFLFALLVRLLVHKSALLSDPRVALKPDSHTYLSMSRNIVQHGNHLLLKTRPPGYAYILAFARVFFGSDLRVAIVLNLLADSMTAGLVVLLAMVAGLALRWRVLAGMLYALSPVPLLWSGMVLTESFFTLSFTLGLWLWFRRHDSGGSLVAFASGVAFGFSALIRSFALLWIPILLIVEGSWSRHSGIRRWLGPGLVAAGAALWVGPIVILHGIKLGMWKISDNGPFSVVTHEAPAILSLDAGRPIGEFFTHERYLEEFLVQGRRELRRIAEAAPSAESGEPYDTLTYARVYPLARQIVIQKPLLLLLIHAAGALKSLAATDYLGVAQSRGPWMFWLALGLLFPLSVGVIAVGFYWVGQEVWNLWAIRRRWPMWMGVGILCVAYLLLFPGSASESRFLMPALPLWTVWTAQGIQYLSISRGSGI